MKRWRAAFLISLLGALPILFAWNRSPSLLQDSDTRGILDAIRRAHDPLKWFRGDWPIENHFYRPIASLTFELDNAVWGGNAAGYGLTNALLCFACVLLLFWVLREVTDRPAPSAAGAVVFGLWHTRLLGSVSDWVGVAAWATLLIGALRHRRDGRAYLPAVLTLFALAYELVPIRTLSGRMIDWIPGRTASTMTVFCLIAIAAYARFERLRRPPAAPETTPETPPATRSAVEGKPPGAAWPWAAVAAVATALALGSYEQAVMLPPTLLIVGFAVKGGGRRAEGGGGPDRGSRIAEVKRQEIAPRTSHLAPSSSALRPLPSALVHAVFWSLLGVYLVLRWQLLPHNPSAYQRQQYASTRTAFWRGMEYLFPPLEGLWGIPMTLEVGLFMLLTAAPYLPLIRVWTLLTGYWEARRERALLILGLLGSAVAYAPMAWFKIFEHYHYWPMAMRAMLVVALGLAALRLAATAWSPPARRAPPRPRPAPGSLPRP